MRAMLLLALLLLTASCVTVEVFNLADSSATVSISLPDAPNGYTRVIQSGYRTETFSNYGGRVTIQTRPSEEWIQLLTSLQQQITQRLFEERATLSASDVALLVERLSQIDTALQSAGQGHTSCTVNAPDFSSVTAVVNWDSATQQWVLDCSVAVSD